MKSPALVIAFAALTMSGCSEGGDSNPGPMNAATEAAAGVNPNVPAAQRAGTAQAAQGTDELMAQIFGAFDHNRDGKVVAPEALSYVVLMLMSQDADDDGRISTDEFHSWDIGFHSIARANGRLQEYGAQKDALFQSWDSNGDQYLTVGEFTDGARRDFRAASSAQEDGISPETFTRVGFVRDLAAAAS